ncbi:MAG: sigma 54-interacting transcriptional regulator [Acidobacteriaceae bacterium]
MSNYGEERLLNRLPAIAQDNADFVQVMFGELFEYSPDAIFVTNSEGKILEANNRAEEMFGYSRTELRDQPIEILIPQRFRKNHPEYRSQYVAHPRTRSMGAGLSLSGQRKDGQEFPLDIMLKSVETPSGPVVLSFVRDISARIAMQDALQMREQHLRSIVDNVSDYALFLLDPTGRIESWNPGAEKIKGYTAEEIIGKHFSCFYSSEDLEHGKPAEELRIAATKGRFEEEGWRIRKDGSRFWADVVITAIYDKEERLAGFAKVARDFTDRKKAEDALLSRLSSLLLANVDIRKLLTAISASIQDVVPHDLATLALFDPVAQELRVQFLESGQGTDSGFSETVLSLDDSPAGLAFRTHESVLVNRLEAAPFSDESLRHLVEMGMRSGCWVPLVNREHTIGTLMVASRNADTFSLREASMLGQIAHQIATSVDNVLAFRQIAELRDRLKQEKLYLEEELNSEHRFEDIVGESKSLKRVLKQIETVAPTDATVLIQGETGTGKELLARAIHRLSPRRERTFIKLNCAAIPAGLIESELFGHEKGAFTGAISQKMGRLELANQGTLFLDEIGEMPLDLQPKLLRALQEREIERLGGTKTISVDVRLIAATNRDLAKLVAEKQFRSDLYYRLKVFPVYAPPLYERREDIPVLVRHFVDKHSRRMGKAIETIPPDAMEALNRCQWPGNIRELENFIERCVILTRSSTLHVPLAELESEEQMDREDESPSLESAEREHILRVLRETNGMIGGPSGAAEKLGLKRTTLNSKIKKLGIERRDYISSL